MKIYTYEEIKDFILSEANKPCNKNLVFCYNRQQQQGMLYAFIVIEDDIRYEIPWHNGSNALEKGSYLHASINDIYGLNAEIFRKCFQIVNFSGQVSP